MNRILLVLATLVAAVLLIDCGCERCESLTDGGVAPAHCDPGQDDQSAAKPRP